VETIDRLRQGLWPATSTCSRHSSRRRGKRVQERRASDQLEEERRLRRSNGRMSELVDDQQFQFRVVVLARNAVRVASLSLPAFSDTLDSSCPFSSRSSTRSGSCCNHARPYTWRSWRCVTSWRSSTARGGTPAFDRGGPNAVGVAVAHWHHWRSALHIVKPETVISSAPAWLSAVLAMEVPTRDQASAR
jgi:hypothetical protein